MKPIVRSACVVAGIVVGGLSALSPGAVFAGVLASVSGIFLHRHADSGNRRFLLWIFLSAFLLRALLSVGLDTGSWMVERQWPSQYAEEPSGWDLGIRDQTRAWLRMGDSDYYSQRAYATAQYLKGNRQPIVLLRLNQYGWNGYVDLMGLFYSLFGFSPCAVKLINCLLGAWLGPLTFFVARERLPVTIARWAAMAVSFFPSLLLWSASNLKDVPLLFLTLTSVLLFIRMEGSRRLSHGVFWGGLLCLALLAHAAIRDFLYLILASAFLMTALLTRLRRGHGLLLLGIVAVLAAAVQSFNPGWLEARVREALTPLLDKHLGYVATAGMSYRFLPPAFYAPYPAHFHGWMKAGQVDLALGWALIKAHFHFFTEPLPWRLDTPLHVPVLFQMWLWYWILPFAVGGILACARRGLRRALPLALPFLFLSSAMAMTNGNVGTLFRVRDLVTPFVLIFACVGLWTGCRDWLRLVDAPRCGTSLDRSFEEAAPSASAHWLRGSLLAARLSSAWDGFRSGVESRLRGVRRDISGNVPFLGVVLMAAVLFNGGVSLFLGRPWEGWSAGFHVSLFFLGLWGWASPSDWNRLKAGSLWVRTLQRLQ